MLRALYISTVRAVRRPCQAIGLLRLLDRHCDRRLVHWLRSQFALYDVQDLVALSTPWWSYKAADQVESWLVQREGSIRAFEWGAGASTMWLASRVNELHSVEHHLDFASTVAAMAPSNVSLHVVEPAAAGPDPVAPSTKPGHEQLDFADYTTTIDDVGGMFDLIVIDGRARVTCLRRALDHLKADGLIVFDNSNRKEYRRALATLHVGVTDYRGLTPASPFPTTTSLVVLPSPV